MCLLTCSEMHSLIGEWDSPGSKHQGSQPSSLSADCSPAAGCGTTTSPPVSSALCRSRGERGSPSGRAGEDQDALMLSVRAEIQSMKQLVRQSLTSQSLSKAHREAHTHPQSRAASSSWLLAAQGKLLGQTVWTTACGLRVAQRQDLQPGAVTCQSERTDWLKAAAAQLQPFIWCCLHAIRVA